LDTQDFVETVKTWAQIYRDNRLPGLDYPPAKDPEIIQWETNMLRIASVIKPPDALANTPAFHKVIEAVKLASEAKTASLAEVYKNLSEVEEYLKESMF